MTTERVYGPSEWIFSFIIILFLFIINACFIFFDYRLRNSKSQTQSSNILSYIASTICHWSGLIYVFIALSLYMPYICHIGNTLAAISLSTHLSSMNLFQLSRLYHCFSVDGIYSSNGYPRWLFIFLFAAIIPFLIWCLIYPSIYGVYSAQCGVDFNTMLNTIDCFRCDPEFRAFRKFGAFYYLFWDIITLSLYTYKTCKFRHFKVSTIDCNELSHHHRIMAVLVRVLIMTMLYEFAFLMGVVFGAEDIFGIFSTITWCGVSVVVNFCMVMMQQHWTDQYRAFLRFLYKIKCVHICCFCVKTTIFYEINGIQQQHEEEEEEEEEEFSSISDEEEMTKTSSKVSDVNKKSASETQSNGVMVTIYTAPSPSLSSSTSSIRTEAVDLTTSSLNPSCSESPSSLQRET